MSNVGPLPMMAGSLPLVSFCCSQLTPVMHAKYIWLVLMAAPNRAAYTASKHGVVGLTREMALELGDKGVRVNAVAPGVVRTPLTERYFQDPNYAQAIRDIHALGRWAEPREIANAILFLADENNGFYHRHNPDGRWRLDDRKANVRLTSRQARDASGPDRRGGSTSDPSRACRAAGSCAGLLRGAQAICRRLITDNATIEAMQKIEARIDRVPG
jgi:hypothetical protein